MTCQLQTTAAEGRTIKHYAARFHLVMEVFAKGTHTPMHIT